MSWPQCVVLACILFYWLAGTWSVAKDRKMTSAGTTAAFAIWLALCVGFSLTLRAGGFW